MDFSIKVDTVKSGKAIVYIEGTEVILKKYCISFYGDRFRPVNSADPDAMAYSAPFHLGLHYLQKYLFKGFQSKKG